MRKIEMRRGEICGNVSFYQQMDGSFMHQMSIPTKFTTNSGGHIGKIVKLKGPSGNIWQIGVTKRAAKFVLRVGWKEFILANDIKENDILIFKYNGNSSFEVQIFQNGCERISSFFAKKKGTGCFRGEVYGPNCNIRHHDIITSGSSSDSEGQTEESPTRDEKPRRQSKKDAGTSRNGGDRREMLQKQPPFLYLSHKTHLNTAQNKKALRLAREVTSGNPYFVAVINSCCIRRNAVLSIPKKFSVEYLPTETAEATLHYMGRKWNAMYIYRKERKQIGSTGWKSFVKDNNLQEGDVCLFELLKDKNEIISFRVHLLKN
ncbi:hypothetical protein LUZ60_001941 [Juncus effusus]|nr:hypothetical protein LUZ60_001941 [Juncus effusus]